MKTANSMRNRQLGELAHFLNEHPTLTPIFSDKAILCGFRVGLCYLSLDNLRQLLPIGRADISRTIAEEQVMR
jgi:hypothetical protein